MAFYTNSVVTKIIDPQFHQSKYRDEYRIVEDGLYSTSNMRICNLGVVSSAAAYGANRAYNKLTGVHGDVKNIYLYDGKIVLDQVQDYKDYGAFKEYNNGNNSNCDIVKMLSKTGLGFVYDSAGYTPSGALPPPKIKEYNPSNGGHIPSDTVSTSPAGYLDLRAVFPLLKQLDFLHTGLFKNLRVVIEYDVSEALTTVSTTGSVDSTLIPVLVIDQIMNDKIAAQWLSDFKAVQWNAVELETVQAPAITAKSTMKYHLNGFSNKTLQNLLLQKKGSTSVSQLYNSQGSETLFGEEIQVYVDGSALLPESGVKRPNHRLALLTSTFGNCNAHPCSANLCMYGADASFDDYLNRVGHTDYFGIAINKKVGTLDVDFTRDVATGLDASYKQALTLNFFGTVSKAIVKAGNSYQVVYL
jgi:hypothetical protein